MYIHIRTEIERLLHWCALIAKISLKDLTSMDLEKYLQFYKNPPTEWIVIKRKRKFYYKEFARIPNPEWKPFIKTGPSDKTLAHLSWILKLLFQHLMLKKHISINTFATIKDNLNSITKTKYTKPENNTIYKHIAPQLSTLQIQYVYEKANEMAEQHPKLHERTLFIISAIYFMNLTLIDLIPIDKKCIIKMNNFFCDSHNNWWFKSIRRKNKLQHLPVNDKALESLKRWRKYLGLGPLPLPNDNNPLFLKELIGGYSSSLTSTLYICRFIYDCLSQASNALFNDKLTKESTSLKKIASRWLKSEEASITMNNKILTAKKMHEENKMSIKEICNTIKISKTTYYKYITLDGNAGYF